MTDAIRIPWYCGRCGATVPPEVQPHHVEIGVIKTPGRLCQSCMEVWCDRVTALFSNFMRVGL